MPINHDDPRVRKTRRGLQEAFIRLILRQGYDSISIQDIADEAETARITFYRHYRDKEDLLTDCLNALYDDLASRTERQTPQTVVAGSYAPLKVLYDHIEEQESLYRVLFSSRGTQTVIERLRHHLATHITGAMQRTERTPQGNIPMELIAYHVASAVLGLAMWWLDHNKPYPSSYMAQTSLWLSLTGLIETMGGAPIKPPVPRLEDETRP